MNNYIYAIFFVLSSVTLVSLVTFFKKRISIFYVLMFCCSVLSNMGYMQLTSAKTLGAAMFANQVIYLGACFSPYFYFLCVADLCKIKISKIISGIFISLAIIIFALICTSSPLYYKSVELVDEGCISRLEKVYGPLHTLFPLHLILMFLASLTVIIIAIKRKKDVSYATGFSLLGSLIFIIAVYAVEIIIDIDFEMLPIAYVIVQCGILVLLTRISLYDIFAIVTKSMENAKNYGFVICDKKGRHLGCDDIAKQWFPELNRLHVDVSMKAGDSDFINQMIKWVNNQAENEIEYFERGDLILEAKYVYLKGPHKMNVHCIHLRDDTQQQKYLKLTREYNENLEKDVKKKTEKIKNIQDDITLSMASIVENRDSNTGGHIARTSDVVKIFVKYLIDNNVIDGLDKNIAECIIKAAPLHDFGKIAVPDVILNKPGKFTDEEYEVMKTHSAKGAVIVKQILHHSEDELFKKIAVNVAHYHHEKWDGRGYPDKISGENIPFEARVMALADVFDALVSKRVYKDSFDYNKAFSIIEESCGSHFDPVLCKAFLHCRSDLENLYNSYND